MSDWWEQDLSYPVGPDEKGIGYTWQDFIQHIAKFTSSIDRGFGKTLKMMGYNFHLGMLDEIKKATASTHTFCTTLDYNRDPKPSQVNKHYPTSDHPVYTTRLQLRQSLDRRPIRRYHR